MLAPCICPTNAGLPASVGKVVTTSVVITQKSLL